MTTEWYLRYGSLPLVTLLKFRMEELRRLKESRKLQSKLDRLEEDQELLGNTPK